MRSSRITLTLTPHEADTIAEALDSHLYWQVNEDRTRRSDGYVLEPYTADEQAVVDMQAKVEAQIRQQHA